jgi:membrane-associated phospholipid phosphatase
VLRAVARHLPSGPRDLIRQIVLFCGAYYLYRIVRGVVDDRVAAAFANAHEIVHIERWLGFFPEPSIQHFSEHHEVLSDLASWMYVNSHFVITTVTLAFIYLRRNDSFYFVRNMFMVAMGVALVLYVVFPTAPPRFLPELGFKDSVANFTGVTPDDTDPLVNAYAAIPSMHVCFAVMLAISMTRLVRHRWALAAWIVYPLMITWVVLATANHWWVDTVLGLMTAAVAYAAAAGLFARLRPDAWALERTPATAGA